MITLIVSVAAALLLGAIVASFTGVVLAASESASTQSVPVPLALILLATAALLLASSPE
ncbi:hypothetical protein [Halosegnis sp.]|uniref:hypothetical protein n=1 Tax=Halosegnis sp. TaxID=2864959 RepID=UPI0035D529A7